MPEPGSQLKLKELEERWQSDRSPRVFLPLADELRRVGRLAEAISVLTAGLEQHADSVSGLVALGRCLLDAGETARAATFLERALERDPTQLVANMLLAECRIRLGDADGARQRLAVSRLLGGRDADLEEMERRIAALAPAAVEAPARAPIFDLAPPAPLADLRLPQPAAGARRAANPFGALLDPVAIRRRIASRLTGEGIFAIAAANAPSAPAAPLAAAPASEVPLFFPRQAIGEAVEREEAEPTWSLETAPEIPAAAAGGAGAEPAASVTLAAPLSRARAPRRSRERVPAGALPSSRRRGGAGRARRRQRAAERGAARGGAGAGPRGCPPTGASRRPDPAQGSAAERPARAAATAERGPTPCFLSA